jgi:hypothetical protein
MTPNFLFGLLLSRLMLNGVNLLRLATGKRANCSCVPPKVTTSTPSWVGHLVWNRFGVYDGFETRGGLSRVLLEELD